MRYKFSVILPALLILVAFFTIYIYINSNEKGEHLKLNTNLIKELERQKKESANVLKRSWGDETLFNPVNAVEGSKDEYITYYAYQTVYLLGESPGRNYCKHLKQVTEKGDFSAETENLIFTGIERVYRAQKSLELCIGETEQTKFLGIEKHVIDLLNSTYIDNGYFISEEFKPYKDKPEYIEVKLQQTYMMIYLANVYKKLDEIDTNQIKLWIKQIPLKDLTIINTITKIDEILGAKTNVEIDIKEVESLVNQQTYQIHDFMSLNSLVELYNKKYIQLDNSIITSIKDKIKKYQFGLSDIQSEYIKNNILKNLNTDINEKEKEILLKDFSTYMYDDGMLPTFSTYNNPLSPSLVGRISEEFTVANSSNHDVKILNTIKNLNMKELMKQDPFEVYSYVTLYKLADSTPDDSQKKELIEMLKQKIKLPINRNNVMSWSFYVKSLINLDEKISVNMLPNNTTEILNSIIEKEKSYFGKNGEISTLVFLETIASTELYQDKLIKTKKFIEVVDADENSEIGAYLIYYKTMLQEILEIPYDKNKTASKITRLFKQSGYSLSTQNKFADVYSTYFLMNVNQILSEAKHNA
ncbi:hypothetical protein ACQCV6_15360 [Bacillus cereus]|uniref:hypothetical protein n=1 Tax=Bacillus cereus TaxID=1396 RepID=UPI003CE8B753